MTCCYEDCIELLSIINTGNFLIRVLSVIDSSHSLVIKGWEITEHKYCLCRSFGSSGWKFFLYLCSSKPFLRASPLITLCHILVEKVSLGMEGSPEYVE